jgi:hypothetical protein
MTTERNIRIATKNRSASAREPFGAENPVAAQFEWLTGNSLFGADLKAVERY